MAASSLGLSLSGGGTLEEARAPTPVSPRGGFGDARQTSVLLLAQVTGLHSACSLQGLRPKDLELPAAPRGGRLQPPGFLILWEMDIVPSRQSTQMGAVPTLAWTGAFHLPLGGDLRNSRHELEGRPAAQRKQSHWQVVGAQATPPFFSPTHPGSVVCSSLLP